MLAVSAEMSHDQNERLAGTHAGCVAILRDRQGRTTAISARQGPLEHDATYRSCIALERYPWPAGTPCNRRRPRPRPLRRLARCRPPVFPGVLPFCLAFVQCLS